jgi:hypothetical protein
MNSVLRKVRHQPLAIASGMFGQFIGNINNVDKQFIVGKEEKFFEKVYL